MHIQPAYQPFPLVIRCFQKVPQMRGKVCGAHKYWMMYGLRKGLWRLSRELQNVPGAFFDCALSKYSSLLSALRFKPFQAAVYFYTRISEKELKIE